MKTHPTQTTMVGIVLGVVLALSGCGRKETPAPGKGALAIPDKNAGAVENLLQKPQNNAPATPVAPPVDTSKSAPPVVDTAEPAVAETAQEAVLKELTAGLQVWLQVKDGYPKDLKQLADAKFIKRVPPAPPGKQYVFDRAHHQVILVDK